LPLPILYGVWHTRGMGGGGRTLCNSRALVLQPCGQCRWPGAVNGCLIRAQNPQTKEYLVKANVCGGLSSTLGVARCGRSAGGVLCALWAVSAVVLGRGYPVGVRISSSSSQTRGCEVSLHKIFVYVEAVVHESPILAFSPPTCIAHPGTNTTARVLDSI